VGLSKNCYQFVQSDRGVSIWVSREVMVFSWWSQEFMVAIFEVMPVASFLVCSWALSKAVMQFSKYGSRCGTYRREVEKNRVGGSLRKGL
jgi:hypothetical protein